MVDNKYKINGMKLYDTNKGIIMTNTVNTDLLTNLINFIIVIFN
jgi:hypothetical protein